MQNCPTEAVSTRDRIGFARKMPNVGTCPEHMFQKHSIGSMKVAALSSSISRFHKHVAVDEGMLSQCGSKVG